MKMQSCVVAAGVAASGMASGQVASFTFSDLIGSFDSASGAYSAVAGDVTSGDVTRLDDAAGSAEFDSGFMLMSSSADFRMDLEVSAPVMGVAAAFGSLTITDANGDVLSAAVDGVFAMFGPAVSFQGQLDDVNFLDNSEDGSFDGPSSGSFSSDFGSSLTGSVISLFFNPGSFFEADFDGVSTQSSAVLIPAPATAALAGLGGLVATRRNRG